MTLKKSPASDLPGAELPQTPVTDADLEKARAWRVAQAENKPSYEEEIAEGAKQQRQIQGNSVVLDAWRRAQEEVPNLPPSVPGTPEDGDEDLGEALRKVTLKRDDNRPLQFQGYLVGWNDVDIQKDPRGTQVQIYVTKSEKIITAVYQWQRKEGLERDRHQATVHENPESALAWLIKDGREKLGPSSKVAWEMACKTWPSLKGHDVEVID